MKPVRGLMYGAWQRDAVAAGAAGEV